jgi:hypothetical protein
MTETVYINTIEVINTNIHSFHGTRLAKCMGG